MRTHDTIDADYSSIGGIPVTVCVATICDNSTIIGASDRMLTAGNVQFEPTFPKIYPLTISITAMVSGDMTIQSELISDMHLNLNTLLKSQPPPDWFNVKDIAYLYAGYFAALKSKRAERDYLYPVNLTQETFITKQKELSAELVNKLTIELINYSLPSSSVIFAGIDKTGPHLFVVNDGDVTCQDAVGFAAIGAGWYHASSHLMFSRYARNQSLPRALILTYTSKKRAEVAPGVGSETDMFMIGPALGSYILIKDEIVKDLQKMYQDSVKSHARADIKAERKANEYVEQINRGAAVPTEQNITKDGDGETSASEEEKN